MNFPTKPTFHLIISHCLGFLNCKKEFLTCALGSTMSGSEAQKGTSESEILIHVVQLLKHSKRA